MNFTPQSPADIRAQAEMISLLLSSGGWHLYEAFLETQENAFMQHVFTAPDPHKMAWAAGALKSIRDLRAWPREYLRRCEAALAAPPTDL